MTNMPYEERIKNRDNDWYYNKCIQQYRFIIKSEGANERYKEEIAHLQQRIDKAVEYINKYEYQKYCSSPYEKDKYIMREEKEGQDLLNILRGDE